MPKAAGCAQAASLGSDAMNDSISGPFSMNSLVGIKPTGRVKGLAVVPPTYARKSARLFDRR